jgi:amidase
MLATALGLRDTLARTVGQFFTKFDVLLTPTLASPPPLIGELALNRVGVTAAAVFDQLFSFAPFTALFNLTGTPAMSVPLHTSQSGLPVGVQFAGRFGADAVLFRLAGQLEQVAPWEHRRPCPCLSGCRLSSSERVILLA